MLIERKLRKLQAVELKQRVNEYPCPYECHLSHHKVIQPRFSKGTIMKMLSLINVVCYKGPWQIAWLRNISWAVLDGTHGMTFLAKAICVPDVICRWYIFITAWIIQWGCSSLWYIQLRVVWDLIEIEMRRDLGWHFRCTCSLASNPASSSQAFKVKESHLTVTVQDARCCQK